MEWRDLTPSTTAELLSAVDCGDGTIREVALRSTYGTAAAQTASVILDVRRASKSDWVRLTIELRGLVNWKVLDIGTFSWVLLDQFQVAWDDTKRIHLDLDPTGEPRTPAEMAQDSHVYLAARDLRWRIDPLPEEY